MYYLYCILNKVNQKKYVGWTNDPPERKHTHYIGLGSKLVYKAILKYGVENFEFNVLCETERMNVILQMEIKTISSLNTFNPNGYNLTEGGEGSLGRIVTDVTREKMSKAQKGKPRTEKHKKAISEGRKGIIFTEEHRANIALSKKGKPRPPEVIEILRQSNIGKKRSEESKLKQSLANKGRPMPEKVKAVLLLSNKTRVLSKESRKKMSDSLKRYNQSKRDKEIRPERLF